MVRPRLLVPECAPDRATSETGAHSQSPCASTARLCSTWRRDGERAGSGATVEVEHAQEVARFPESCHPRVHHGVLLQSKRRRRARCLNDAVSCADRPPVSSSSVTSSRPNCATGSPRRGVVGELVAQKKLSLGRGQPELEFAAALSSRRKKHARARRRELKGGVQQRPSSPARAPGRGAGSAPSAASDSVLKLGRRAHRGLAQLFEQLAAPSAPSRN